jgi:large subunit ribosomal protein L10
MDTSDFGCKRVAFFVRVFVTPRQSSARASRKDERVPISKSRKDEIVATYVELLQKSGGFAVVETKGMPVPQVNSLRRKVLEAGGQYMVIKNTLLVKAREQVGWTVPASILKGPTGVAFGNDNFPGVAKVVLSYIDTEKLDAEKFKVLGGVMGGDQVLNAAGVKTVSDLPTLPELQAQIIGLIVQPAVDLVTILDAANAGVVNVLQALLDKDKPQEGAA